MTAFDTILDALDRVGMKTHGAAPSVRSQCPHHHSRGLTLSLRQFNDRAGVNCFAGCHVEDVLSAIGLGLRDLYDEPGNTGPKYAPRQMSPWEVACARIGVHSPPSIDHVLARMAAEEAKERGVSDR